MSMSVTSCESAFSGFRSTVMFGKTGYGAVVIHPEQVELPSQCIPNYESYCGAGSGIGDLLVPETIYGVRVSPACYIHDKMFEIGLPTLTDFKICNAVFVANLTSLVSGQSYNSRLNLLFHLRMYRLITYYNSVDTVGKRVYFDLKEKQKSKKVSSV